MKKKFLRSLICFLLSVIIITDSNMGAFATYAAEITEDETTNLDKTAEDEVTEEEESEEFMPTGSSYLYPFEEAVTALEELVESNAVQGVIYLADEVTMRMLPEEGSEPVKNLSSGSVVNILGVGQDAGYQIWYRVSFENEYEEVTGYVPKDNLVCVNSEFLQWEENYVRSIAMFGRMRGPYIPTDISAFPKSYQKGLSALKDKHPNWMFVRLNTHVNWETMLQKQIGNRSWINNAGCQESWKAGPASQEGWSLASRGIIRHYMDPRNWFTEEYVFQFELLGFEPQLHTEAAVEKLLAGSFMSNTWIDEKMTYAQAFVEIGRAADVSPMFLAARVIQEQGYQGNSPLISGKYPNYENYYNYFNIKASGNGETETIENGLKHAKEKGWDTRYKALEAGIKFLLTDYIRAGQNTLYLQKFDAVGEIATHQYMQNIKAPAQEASTVHKGYNNGGLLSQSFVFIIPVYENMPEKAAAKPGQEDKITLSSAKIENLQVDSEVTLQPLVNGNIVEGARFEFASSNPEVAKVDPKGTIKAMKAGETTITCKDLDDPENPNIGTCTVTVVQADIDIAALKLPELKAITYDPNRTLKDIKLQNGYTWVNPEIIPCVDQTAYAVIYNPDEEKYNPITFDLSLEVKKKPLTPADCTMPADLMGGAGRELSSVGLPAGFYWNDPTELLPDTIGTKQYLLSYNPDVSNYETLKDIKVSVTIVCEKHQLSDWMITEATCEEDGSKIRTCKTCQYREELVLAKTGHHYEAEVTQEATEETEGIRTYTCNICDKTYTEVIPKLPSTHEHKYEEEITKKATCEGSGLKTFTCSCEDKYTEVIEATGHKMVDGHCQICGHPEKDEVPPAEKPEPDKPADEGPKEEPKPDKPADDVNKEEPKPDKPADEKPKEEPKPDKPAENVTENKKPENSTEVKPEAKPEVKPEVKPEEAKPQDKVEPEETKQETPAASTEEKQETPTVSTEAKPEVKPEEVKTEETKPQKSEEIQQTKPENNINQVEIELMSELVENVAVENEAGEKPKVEIQLNKNTEISQKIVEMAKDHGVDLEVSLPNNLKWTINAETLTNEMASSINMNAEIVSEVIDKKVIETVTSEEEYMELSLSHNGEFGFEATLTIPVEEKYVGQVANLFYFNEKTGELEFQMEAPVDEDGNIQLFFNHASDYVIVFSKNSMADVVTNIEMPVEEETSDVLQESDVQKADTSGLLTTCIVIMILAGGLAAAGYFIYFNKKEISDGQDFEEWLKADASENKPTEKEIKKEDKYLDDDVDDYQEKEKAPEVIFNTGEIRLKEEDYLDDDVDDYQEKDSNENTEDDTDYLDDDVDDYKEKM